ncbi:tether containing UBX domain for GLUT4-like [Eriocheir sinensis]|uniref:tether containing UBX domain for GLUT4-like n=1 Tax=Eriocheir sinensis TaxID=95602 RepID=UPI0021C5C323|nr:tether containing UBX domain for GLUT4-like [Eriocheir sinensis]
MAGMSVTVLCPNGRRVNVKVTPNTSVLQIIEEASLKHSLNPDHYDLVHLRRALDTGSSVRHAGLPNRCQLEMVEAAVPRSPANVTVHIATETGLRLVHDFPCTTTLWDILEYHKQNSDVSEDFLPPVDSHKEVVLVYAMRRISCPELTKVTLRTLGIMSGKCMLRHSVQSTSLVGHQPHVSSSLTRRSVDHMEDQDEEAEPKPSSSPAVNYVWLDGEVLGSSSPPVARPREEEPSQQSQESDVTMEDVPEVPQVPTSKNAMPPSRPSQSGGECSAPLDLTTSPRRLEASPPPRVIKIGDHNAIVFSMADAPPTLTGEEDDVFFQLTAEEVRRLYREQRKALRELEETPLMTQSMRELEESSKVLTALNRYPVTHLRIHFPDEHVIQATFKPNDTVKDVMTFLRPFLTNPTAEFTLSTRHPQRTLCPDISLVTADCVPNARLYYWDATTTAPFLSEDTLAKKSSYSGACSSLNVQSTKARPLGVNEKGHRLSEPSTSSRRKEDDLDQDTRPQTSARVTGAVPKVPKWFKVGK